MKAASLRTKIIRQLRSQGFSVNGSVKPKQRHKNTYRKLQHASRIEQLILQRSFLLDHIDTVKKYLINGKDIVPENISLELREVGDSGDDYILYRWWNLVWWSVPYQKAYGRQMRFLLWDKTHNAPFGIIGLQSPVLRMSVRDSYLNIPNKELDIWVNKSLQAQRLGALPPYNMLLGGKMVALAATSSELRKAYKRKYSDTVTIMKRRVIEPDLLFLTTTSAFGKGSIYNRLRVGDESVAISLGYTKGSGTFHIPENLYNDIKVFLRRRKVDTSTTFGHGPSRKMKIIDTAMSKLNLNNYTYHNIQREFFLFPLAKNLKTVISKNVIPRYYNRKLNDMTNFWKERWAIPRSQKFNDWKEFKGEIATKKLINELLNGKF